jgi:hypothetical protein
MSDSRNHPSLPTSEAGIELYHYYRDPAMASAQYNEGYETRSSILNSPDIHGLDAARPASFSFRSSVSLIPTPGAVSTRHPTYEPLLLRFWFVTLGCLLLGAIGVGLEIARVISKDNGGAYWASCSRRCADLIYYPKASTSLRKMCFPSPRFSS